jgi:Fe-S-cluster containining protein
VGLEPPTLKPTFASFAADDRRLLAVVDAAGAEAARRAGAHLVCRAGCTECCIGPFPVTALDAARLDAGLSELAAADPARAARIRERATAAAAALAEGFPGDARRGILGEDEAAREAFFTRYAAMPCPVLDPDTGFCELYAHRPISCRTFGPPMRIEDENLPPCRLCFGEAAPEEIEACRVPLECHSLEAPLTARAEASAGRAGETLIALALASTTTPSSQARTGTVPEFP